MRTVRVAGGCRRRFGGVRVWIRSLVRLTDLGGLRAAPVWEGSFEFCGGGRRVCLPESRDRRGDISGGAVGVLGRVRDCAVGVGIVVM